MENFQTAREPVRMMKCRRVDWSAVIQDLYTCIIRCSPFGICLVAREPSPMGMGLNIHINPHSVHKATTQAIRARFTKHSFERLMRHAEGLEPLAMEPVESLTINVGGLPRGCLIVRIVGRVPRTETALAVFSGFIMPSELEGHIARMGDVMVRRPQGISRPSNPRSGPDHLLPQSNEEVRDLELLSRIVNEESRPA
jgi:hypothetical protein